MSEPSPIPSGVRRLVALSAVFLIVSLILTGLNGYIAFAAPAFSPYVPSVVGFEGRLADAAGQPVADGNYTITFSLYSEVTGGTALWSETQSVAVMGGLYSVQLGSVTPLAPNQFEGNRWLGVTIAGDSEMAPRIFVSAVPYAFSARQAMGLQGRDVAAAAPQDGDVLRWDATSSQWVPGSSSGSGIPAGAILMVPGDCPSGFVEYTAAQGRYIVGVPLNGTLAATVGTALLDQEDRPVGQHSHTINDPGHFHTYNSIRQYDGGYNPPLRIDVEQDGSSQGIRQVNSSTTGITINNSGTVSSTNAPYIQLRFCQKS